MQTMPAPMNAVNLAPPVKPKTPIIMKTIANNAYTTVRIMLSLNLLTFISRMYELINIVSQYYCVYYCSQLYAIMIVNKS